MKAKGSVLAAACLLALLIPSAATGEASQLASDLSVLRNEYVMQSGAFGPAERKKALAEVSALESTADVGKLDFFLAVSRVTALADNAHDSVMRGHNAWQPLGRLPVRFIWFPDALLIARASGQHEDVLGAQVLSIDGHPLTAVMSKLQTIQGGTDEYRRWQSAWVLTSPEVLHALGISQSASAVTFTLKDRRGDIITRTISAVPSSELPAGARPGSYWYTTPLPGEVTAGWITAATTAPPPLYLQEPEKLFRAVELPELPALYVQFRTNMDEDDQQIASFVEYLTKLLHRSPPENLILDLRFDVGGDNTQNRDLMRQIASRVPGRVYLLVGPYTFSAGIASAAALKHDGGAKVTIIGSEMGDRARWWSEGAMVCLPTSDVCVVRNAGYWDVNFPCADKEGCFSDQFSLDVPLLRPDVPAPIKSVDWLHGRDPAMEAVREDLAAASRRG